jgi:hypothetical protein
MFRTNNCSSSSGGLYEQLTVFLHASCEESSRWYDTIGNHKMHEKELTYLLCWVSYIRSPESSHEFVAHWTPVRRCLFPCTLIKHERVSLIDQPRGRDISHNFDVESRGHVVPVRDGILCSLCPSPVCAATDRTVRGFVILRAVVTSLPGAISWQKPHLLLTLCWFSTLMWMLKHGERD